MRDLRYHPDWDLFPLDKLPQGTGLKIGKAADKKLDDFFWFLRQKLLTLLVQQQSYICHDTFNLKSRA